MADRQDLHNKKKKKTIWYLPALLDEVRKWPKAVKEEIGLQLNMENSQQILNQ